MQPFLNPPDNLAPVVIYEDGGGLVKKYEEAAIQYNLEKRRVEIRGSCRSACTLALSVKNVCVDKNAKVLWHHAFNTDDHTPRYDVTREMLSLIPFKVAQRVGPYISIQYNDSATLKYAELIQLGVADCDAPAPTVQASVTTLPPATTQPTTEQILGTVPALPQTEAAADPVALAQQQFDAAYNDAIDISRRQNGSPATLHNCDKYHCEDIVAYYDKHSRYVELHRSADGQKRVICRLSQEGLFEDTYNCTNWVTGEKIQYHWSRDKLYERE